MKNIFFFPQHESIKGYQSYVYGILGFFVVEDHILNTGNGLATRSYLEELWSMALSKIVNALRTHSVNTKKKSKFSNISFLTKINLIFFFKAYCTDATLILKIKNLIMLFNTTLRVSFSKFNFFLTIEYIYFKKKIKF